MSENKWKKNAVEEQIIYLCGYDIVRYELNILYGPAGIPLTLRFGKRNLTSVFSSPQPSPYAVCSLSLCPIEDQPFQHSVHYIDQGPHVSILRRNYSKILHKKV